MIEQTAKARITEIYLFFKKTNFCPIFRFTIQTFLRSAPEEGLYCKPKYRAKICFFKKQIYFSYSSFCCLFYQARHLRRWDQSAVNILCRKKNSGPICAFVNHFSLVHYALGLRCSYSGYPVGKASLVELNTGEIDPCESDKEGKNKRSYCKLS